MISKVINMISKVIKLLVRIIFTFLQTSSYLIPEAVYVLMQKLVNYSSSRLIVLRILQKLNTYAEFERPELLNILGSNRRMNDYVFYYLRQSFDPVTKFLLYHVKRVYEIKNLSKFLRLNHTQIGTEIMKIAMKIQLAVILIDILVYLTTGETLGLYSTVMNGFGIEGLPDAVLETSDSTLPDGCTEEHTGKLERDDDKESEVHNGGISFLLFSIVSVTFYFLKAV